MSSQFPNYETWAEQWRVDVASLLDVDVSTVRKPSWWQYDIARCTHDIKEAARHFRAVTPFKQRL